MHVCGIQVHPEYRLSPTQHPRPIHFYGEIAQQWAYEGHALLAVLPDIPIQQISTKSTICRSPSASCRVSLVPRLRRGGGKSGLVPFARACVNTSAIFAVK